MKRILVFITVIVVITASFSIYIFKNIKKTYTPYQIEYSDDSVLKSDGFPHVYHNLFGDYYVSNNGDSRFCQSISIRHFNGISYKEEYITNLNCYFERYAFDPTGYIAYYCYVSEKTRDSDDLDSNEETGILYENKYILSDQYAGLYDCKRKEEIRFDSFDELIEFADSNSINLGDYYSITPYGLISYKDIAINNGWSVVPKSENGKVLYKKHEIFAGNIKKYNLTDDILFVELEICKNTTPFQGANNPEKCKYISAKNSIDLTNGKTVFIKIDTNSNEVTFYKTKKLMFSDNSEMDIKLKKPEKT